MGSPSAPKAPKAPPAPTQTRREAQFLLDQQLREGNASGLPGLNVSPRFGNPFGGSIFGKLIGDPQERLDARPDSDFLPPVDDRDFQSLDAQIRGASEGQGNTVRNREMQRSLLELLGEDVNSPTIL